MRARRSPLRLLERAIMGALAFALLLIAGLGIANAGEIVVLGAASLAEREERSREPVGAAAPRAMRAIARG